MQLWFVETIIIIAFEFIINQKKRVPERKKKICFQMKKGEPMIGIWSKHLVWMDD